jgi:parallel beta-helix repeat protein
LAVGIGTVQAQGATPTPRAPIFINGDSQFTPANGVTGGSGTQADPYIIENWVIDASGAIGITIQNTTKYFVVWNCLVENGGNYIGIYLDNAINGKVENNTCENNSYGIYLTSSSSNTIFYNYLLNNTENNAYDGSANSWDNNGKGNYWSDWQPPQHTATDGIVNEPRSILGGTNQDNYPLVLPAVTSHVWAWVAAVIGVLIVIAVLALVLRGKGK